MDVCYKSIHWSSWLALKYLAPYIFLCAKKKIKNSVETFYFCSIHHCKQDAFFKYLKRQMSWFFRKLQKLWGTATQLCSPIPLLSGFVLWTPELYLCLGLLEFLTLQKAAFPMRCYLHSPSLLHPQTLISLKQFPYHKHKPPILISLDINVEGAVNVKCSTTVMFMDHLWKASFRQAAANAGGINSSHKLMFPLQLTWMFLPSLAVITGTIHA